jgi:hypothetical protein
MKIAKQDYKFVPVDPDPSFDPEHNRRVIEETIKNSKILQERKRRESADKVGLRTQAVAQYLSSLNTGKTSSSVNEYFGRHEMARLRGEEIREVIRAKIGDEIKKRVKTQAVKS